MQPKEIAPEHFSPDIRDFIRLLAGHDVRYMIVGGEAVIYYGHARLTGDVDFFFDASAENAGRLFSALGEFWKGNIPQVGSAEELREPGLVLQFGVPPNRIDLINGISGMSFTEAWPSRHAVPMTVAGAEVPVVYLGLKDLIRNKAASARPKDLDDLGYLRAAE